MAIKGLRNVQNMLQKKTKGYRNGVRSAVREIGQNIEQQAKVNAPLHLDSLISGAIVSSKDSGYGYVIRVSGLPSSNRLIRNLPVYMEFGAGVYAGQYVPTLPKEWQEAASNYIENKEGKTKTHSYLYPAWNTHGSKFIEKVKGVLKKS